MRWGKTLQVYLRFWQRCAYNAQATLPAHAVNCPECGLHTHIPALSQGQEACCPRCHHTLVRVEDNPFITPIALAVATLIVLACVYSMMFITVTLTGVYARITLPTMMKTLFLQDFGFLAEVMFLFTFGTPLFFLLLCLYVFGALAFETPVLGLRSATRTMVRLREWIMVDVFFISTLVAYIKLQAVSQVEFGAAFWLLLAMSWLLIRTSVATPEHWVYYQIHRINGQTPITDHTQHDTICCSRCLYHRPIDEMECQVCGNRLFTRRPHSLRLSLAFLLAAAILYFPANLLPIMISANPMKTEISTILSGILFMWRDGDKVIAAIIFSASILVPSLKIISMATLIASAHFGLPMSIHRMSQLYRITEAVGRWSMIDIFVIIILMSAFHTPIARVTPGPAALYFCLVVLLTMLSAHYFDPRLLWDKHHNTLLKTH